MLSRERHEPAVRELAQAGIGGNPQRPRVVFVKCVTPPGRKPSWGVNHEMPMSSMSATSPKGEQTSAIAAIFENSARPAAARVSDDGYSVPQCQRNGPS